VQVKKILNLLHVRAFEHFPTHMSAEIFITAVRLTSSTLFFRLPARPLIFQGIEISL